MRALFLLALLNVAAPAFANHPDERLDEVTADKEPAFESVDGPLSRLSLQAADASDLGLRELADRIVVLSFVPEGCGERCADQQELLIEVQSAVNVTPMRDMVTFVTVAATATPADQGWNADNWQRARTGGEETVAELAADMADRSQRAEEAPMVHIVDRGARRAAIFHGAEFGPINMVLYINGLTNAHPPEPGFLERLFGWLP